MNSIIINVTFFSLSFAPWLKNNEMPDQISDKFVIKFSHLNSEYDIWVHTLEMDDENTHKISNLHAKIAVGLHR